MTRKRRAWRAEELKIALLPKLFIGGTFLWAAQFLPSPIPLLLVVSAIVVVLSAGLHSVFSSASGIGLPGWIFAIILSPVRGEAGIPLKPGIVLFVLALLAIRHTHIVLSTHRTSASSVAPPAKLVGRDLLQAGAMVALIAVVLAPTMAFFGTPSAQSGSLFGGQGDGAQPYWGFTDQMDTAARGDLGDEVVMRVQADAPSFWRGQSFDTWDGRVWRRSERSSVVARSLSASADGITSVGARGGVVGEVITQTFTLEQDGSDVVFGAPDIVSIDHPVDRFVQFGDDSIRAPIDLAGGSQYTVVSERPFVTPELLRDADPLTRTLPDAIIDQYLPGQDGAENASVEATPKVRDLALRITAGAPTAYDKIRALEEWMGRNIVYDTNIPTLPPGADAVEHLLFVDKVGFCEQIGSALAVMARSLGIPARLAVGYVPNEFDRFRGTWTVRGRDAHSWTEIYFPGVGWQGFDPTAEVPLSGPRPDPVVDEQPIVSLVSVVASLVFAGVLVAVGAMGLQIIRHRSKSWEQRASERLDRLGADAGRPRRPGEGVGRYAEILGTRSGRAELLELGDIMNRVQFSPEGETDDDRLRCEALLSALEGRS